MVEKIKIKNLILIDSDKVKNAISSSCSNAENKRSINDDENKVNETLPEGSLFGTPIQLILKEYAISNAR